MRFQTKKSQVFLANVCYSFIRFYDNREFIVLRVSSVARYSELSIQNYTNGSTI